MKVSHSAMAASFAIICGLPEACQSVINASFSAGEGNSVSNYVQVACQTADGPTIYIHWIVNGWGLIGLNRVTVPEHISFGGPRGSKLDCKQEDE